MKNNATITGLLTLALGLAVAGSLFADDWPQWRGANRDGVATGFKPPGAWPQALTQKWKVDVGIGDSTPALVGGNLFTFGRRDTNEVVLCLDAATGAQVWEVSCPADYVVTGAAARHPGPRSSPAVSDGRVYAFGVGGILSCLDARKGALLWRKQSTNDYAGFEYKYDTAMSPVLVDGLCIVHVGGKGKGALFAFDASKGTLKWKWDGEPPANSSPVIMTVQGKKQLVTLASKSLVGVSCEDGTLLWQVPFQTGQGNNTTPVVDGQTVICAVQGRGMVAFRIGTQTNGFAATPLWTNSSAASRFTTPVLKDGLLFGFNGRFHCVSARTGETLWTDTANRGNSAAIVDAGPVMLAQTVNSELVAFKPGDKEYSELARIKVAGTETWAHPVVSGSRIYVRDRDSVTLWTLE
jgi:outer membrane protein assembly factor BamB